MALAFGLLCWLDVGVTEKVIMMALVVLVFVVELLNSAIEAVVDRVGVEHHELSGRAKDIGSAAVLVMLMLAGGSWLYIIGSHYWWGQ